MRPKREDLRQVKVFTPEGDLLAFFHCWTDRLNQPEYSEAYSEKMAIVEMESGKVEEIEPKYLTFLN